MPLSSFAKRSIITLRFKPASQKSLHNTSKQREKATISNYLLFITSFTGYQGALEKKAETQTLRSMVHKHKWTWLSGQV